MRVHDDLLIALKGHGISEPKILGCFNDLVMKALSSPPTYKEGDRVNWAFIQHGSDHNQVFSTNFWMYKGYFANTGIFFKMLVAKESDHKPSGPNCGEYFAKFEIKVRPMKSMKRKRNTPPRENFRCIRSDYVSDLITEHEIFEQSTVEPLKVPLQRSLKLKSTEVKERVRKKKVKKESPLDPNWVHPLLRKPLIW
jgi:hypothetical protein